MYVACNVCNIFSINHVTQLSWQSYAENQTSMQTDTHSSDKCQLHYLSFFYYQESDASKQLNSRRRENTVKMQAINSRCNDFD